MEQQEVVYVGAEDHTSRGYNTSMNFWYVGGEVIFTSDTVTLPEEVSFLEMDVKSPVMDPVEVWVRLYPDGDEMILREAGTASVEGNTVQVDLRDLAGKTVHWEVVYSWEQSSLITVRPEFPAGRIMSGAAEMEMETETVSRSESEEETTVQAETGIESEAVLETKATVPLESETEFNIETLYYPAQPGQPSFFRTHDFGMLGLAFGIIVLLAGCLLRIRYDMKKMERMKEMEAAWREKKQREKEEAEKQDKAEEPGTENIREEWLSEFERYEKKERKGWRKKDRR